MAADSVTTWVGLGLTAVSVVGGGITAWLRNIDARQEKDLEKVRSTQSLLFTKHDSVTRELQEYKLHVAETYINRSMLIELLKPLEKRLDLIDQRLTAEGK